MTAGKSFLLGYTDEKDGIYEASKDNPIILFDDFTTSIQWVDFSFKVKSSACKILVPKGENDLRYSFYAMMALDYEVSSHKRHWISEYSKLLVIDRPECEKKQIVLSLDKIQKEIDAKEDELSSFNELIKSRFIRREASLCLM